MTMRTVHFGDQKVLPPRLMNAAQELAQGEAVEVNAQRASGPPGMAIEKLTHPMGVKRPLPFRNARLSQHHEVSLAMVREKEGARVPGRDPGRHGRHRSSPRGLSPGSQIWKKSS